MTSAPFDPHHRPDQARFARTTVGMASPLWFPFLMAASAGAAWWTYTNWARVGVQPRPGAGEEDSAPPPAPAPEPAAAPVAASSALAESLGVQGAAEEPETSTDEEVSELIDAAYAANLGPVPTPPEQPAKKRAAAKSATGKKTAAKKTTPAKTSAKAPAKKTAAKKTAAKAPAKKRGS